MRSLVWFRRDLRASDNKALFQASLDSRDGIIGLFIITPGQWKKHDDAVCKVKFWLDNLGMLSCELAKLRIPLLIEICDSFDDVPARIVSVAEQNGCSSLYLNREYEFNETRRDHDVWVKCEQAGMAVRRFHDRVIVPPPEIQTKQGNFYSVFTPYQRVWNTKALEFTKVLAKPARQPHQQVRPMEVPGKIPGYDFEHLANCHWKPGEAEAQKQLREFSKKICHYNDTRDVPSTDGTSKLSPYLTTGVLSPRQCLAAVVDSQVGLVSANEGIKRWVSEFAWRDFYSHVLVGYPRVSKHQPFKLKTNHLNWRSDKTDFTAWCKGQTGYPLVDAGMRQLNQTGWMHNRLRMVTAMFLTKNLLIDWRWGEQYFMQNLIDGDLAANNGGWQWSASTGTDAVPYFRIFNPFSQSKRFDPEGVFIKRMCPELDAVPPRSLHDPEKLSSCVTRLNLDYPDYIVDYKAGRKRALNAFKSL